MPRKKNPAPKLALAANLKALLDAHKMSGPALAQRAGIDRKSVNNMLNARYNPNYDNVEAVAEVFGLTGWQLILPDLHTNLPMANEVRKLLENFHRASDEGRRTILNVAEMTGTYDKKK